LKKDISTSHDIPWKISDHLLRKRLEEAGRKQGWWDTEKPVVLAVSGGSDSIALLWFFRSFWQGPLVVAHLEHGIRDKTSLRDAAFVEKLCKVYNLPFEIAHISVPREKEKGESTEEAGRRIRYAFLSQVMEKHGASFVATAHTADDVAETVFMNLARGTGPFGLAGIPEKRDHYIRPLISFYREELRNIIRSRGIQWCEDETNEDVSYLRNRVRLEALPWLAERFNPRIKEHLVALSSQMHSVKEGEKALASDLVNWSLRDLPFSMLTLDHGNLKQMGRNTLSMMIRESGARLGLSSLSRVRTDNLLDLVLNSGRWRFQWQGSVEVFAGQGLISFVDRDALPGTDDQSTVLDMGSEINELCWNTWNFDIRRRSYSSEYQALGSRSMTFPADEEKLSIFPVEEHYPGNDEASFIKIVPWWIRQVWPVFCLGSKISWLPFYGRMKIHDQEDLLQKGDLITITLKSHR